MLDINLGMPGIFEVEAPAIDCLAFYPIVPFILMILIVNSSVIKRDSQRSSSSISNTISRKLPPVDFFISSSEVS